MSTIAGILLSATAANAATVSLLPTGNTNEYEIDFSPITFTRISSSPDDLDWLVFEDFFSTNSNARGRTVSGSVQISLDGAAATTHAVNTNSTGTFDVVNNGIDPNDLFVNIALNGPNNVAQGTEVTISGADIIFTSADVPDITSSSIVSATIYQGGSVAVTDAVDVSIVPEPSSVVLSMMGFSAMVLRRRR